jgi:hypothetical protein
MPTQHYCERLGQIVWVSAALISECGGISDLVTAHQMASNYDEAAILAPKAGVDADLPDGACYTRLPDRPSSSRPAPPPRSRSCLVRSWWASIPKLCRRGGCEAAKLKTSLSIPAASCACFRTRRAIFSKFIRSTEVIAASRPRSGSSSRPSSTLLALTARLHSDIRADVFVLTKRP